MKDGPVRNPERSPALSKKRTTPVKKNGKKASQ